VALCFSLPDPQPGSALPGGTRSPPLPSHIPGSDRVGLGSRPCAGGGAGGGRGPRGLLRKASLCYTFPAFYGVVLFMAGEGNEQLARWAKANTAAVERPSGLTGALLGGGGAGGDNCGGP